MFICPVCGLKLNKSGNKYICDKNHSYDLARQGYVNLLPVSGKKSKFPGDNEVMSVARREFLNGGYYSPLKDKILQILSQNEIKTVVDSGCSEGYYTKAMAQTVEKVYAFDISKTAVKIASAEDKKSNYFVASAFRIPIKDGSADCVTKIFAPDSPNEFARILNKNGKIIEVIPAEKHLLELKQKLYETVYLNKIERAVKEGFELEKEQILEYKFIPDPISRQNLFKMTPYYYKTNPEKRNSLLKEEKFPITAEFIIREYKKIEK